eukprot:c20816_g1_i1.p1 GENE.c20816_g1_i1~~c20816_g1_i1.p1  ORF type:complete len:709 (+),score=162.23 c20816_g1_i1:45-2171(+)
MTEEQAWVDVTEDLENASNEMTLGDMIHTTNFNLHDAMSAVQICDPKMDTGFGVGGILTLEDAVLAGLVPESISHAQTVEILCALLIAEVKWYRGLALVQTIYNCLYMHDLHMTRTPLSLKGYGLVLCCAVEQVNNLVNRASVSFEEDFLGNTLTLNTHSDTPPAECLNILKAAMSQLEAEQETANAATAKHIDLILAFLRLRKALFTAHTELAGEQLKSRNLEPLRKALLQAQTSVSEIKSKSLDGQYENVVSFDVRVCQVMMGMMLPQPFKKPSLHQALDELNTTISHLLLVCSLPKLRTLTEHYGFLMYLASLEPNIIVRSAYQIVHLAVVPEDSIMAMIVPHLEAYGVGQTVSSHPYVAQFLPSLAQEHIIFMRSLCLNTARQWRTMNTILEGWNSLAQQAAEIDGAIYNNPELSAQLPNSGVPTSAQIGLQPLSSYVIAQLLGLMTRYIELGATLQLFQGDDIRMVFWYYEHLTMMHNQVHKYTQSNDFTLTMPASAQSPNKDSKKKKGKDKEKDKRRNPVDVHALALQLLTARNALARGLWLFVCAVTSSGVYNEPPPPVPSWPVSRFNARLEAFSKVQQPAPLPYEKYVAACSRPGVKPQDRFAESLESLQQAIVRFETAVGMARTQLDNNTSTASTAHLTQVVADTEALLKTAKANFLSLRLTYQVRVDQTTGVAKPDKTVPRLTFDFSQHRVFPVIKCM